MNNMKKTIPSILVFMLLFSFVPLQAEAAGAKRFDYENSGVEQIYEYTEIYDDEWNSTGEWGWEPYAHYEYYPDGTIKTAFSNWFGWDYEGHYDPHGHLMDPSIIHYIEDGYTEGIALDSESNVKPMRKYDREGRLVHFEAMANNAYDSFIVRLDYEYDDQNRISRVYYEYDIPEDSDNYDSLVSSSPACTVFKYSDDGSYKVVSSLALPEEGYSLWQAFSYDAGHRLVRREEYTNGYDEIDYGDESDFLFLRNKELYTYDDDGLLIHYQRFNDYSSEIDESIAPFVDVKYEYHWADEQTLQYDVSYREGQEEGEAAEYGSEYSIVFDDAGRVIKDWHGEYRYDLAGTGKAQG